MDEVLSSAQSVSHENDMARCDARKMPLTDTSDSLVTTTSIVVIPLVCDSWLLDEFIVMLFRRCSTFGIRIAQVRWPL